MKYKSFQIQCCKRLKSRGKMKHKSRRRSSLAQERFEHISTNMMLKKVGLTKQLKGVHKKNADT
eukprot:UN22772